MKHSLTLLSVLGFGILNLLPTTLHAATFVAASSFQSPTAGTSVYTRIKSDSPGVVNGLLRWTSRNVYILDRLTYVEDGVNLVIEPGTLIRGEEGTLGPGTFVPDNPGALVILRGSKLVASGTPQRPIIWTSLEDPYVPGGTSTIPTDAQQDVAGTQTMPGYDYSPTGSTGNNGLSHESRWGGIVILGNAIVGHRRFTGTETATDPSGGMVNGVGAAYLPGLSNIQSTIYGGNNDDDDSGVLRFNSLRYGGTYFTQNSANGITLGAVGRATVLEFCEVYNFSEDDFEILGGTVNAKYLASLYGGDDGFDTSEGYRGMIQFGFQIQNNIGMRTTPASATGRLSGNIGDSLTENSGPYQGSYPYSIWRRYNMTHVGVGPGGASLKTNALGINFQANSGGKVFNSIVTESEDGGLAINGPNNTGTNSIDSAARVAVTRGAGGEFNMDNTIVTTPAGPDLVIQHNMFWKTGSTGAATELQVMPEFTGSVTGRTSGANDLNKPSSRQIFNSTGASQIGEGNTFATDPLLVAIDRLNNAILDPRLQSASTARTSTKNGADDAFSNGFFTSAEFKGAFKDNNWLAGWSHLENMNILTAAANTVQPSITLGRSSTNPTVTFAVEATKSYSVEKSTDLKTYTPIATGTIAGTGTLYKGTVTATGAGSVTVTDTASTISNGVRIHYRVITQ